jgi:hypothetical protein
LLCRWQGKLENISRHNNKFDANENTFVSEAANKETWMYDSPGVQTMYLNTVWTGSSRAISRGIPAYNEKGNRTSSLEQRCGE